MESLIVPATLESLDTVNKFIVRATSQVGLDDHAAWQVQLAVDEAVTNVIQHAYDDDSRGTVELGWQLEGDTLEVRLHDHGRRFDPSSVPAPDITASLDEREPGGLGLFLMSKLMDGVRFEYDAVRGNTLIMVKQIERAGLNVSIFALAGRLDAAATNQALERPRAAIAAGARKVLIDLQDVTFMSSSGLRALLLLRKDLLSHGGELRLCAMRETVHEVFALTGFTQVFAIHSTREEALAAFEQG